MNIQARQTFDEIPDNENEEINSRITEDEIKSTIKKLKNNKASGIDRILNEHLKSLSHIISPTI